MDTKQQEEAYEKEVQLIKHIKSFKKVLVAFSGGVDSTYLLAIAQESLGENCKAVFARGPIISTQEEIEARTLIELHNFSVHVLDYDVLTFEEFRKNPPNRCYLCKKKLFEEFLKLNNRLHNARVIEGTNASDVEEYRPGRIALRELGIVSPLMEVGLTKAEIRVLSKRRNLSTWNRPSQACLASRVPYGDLITAELLQRIEQAEAILRQKGYTECRVRVHGTIARIEIPIEKFSECLDKHSEITTPLLQLGFRFVTLDLKGLRSGSLNPI